MSGNSSYEVMSANGNFLLQGDRYSREDRGLELHFTQWY